MINEAMHTQDTSDRCPLCNSNNPLGKQYCCTEHEEIFELAITLSYILNETTDTLVREAANDALGMLEDKYQNLKRE